ncbi:unnamed protein product [Acanthoscelides obtectus]|uniref:Uncharacterized protein n=1 Tax=Acanthoscelides obtectus TaxID=200917 RepID=A0A9P0M4G6_ACAOB|nr:unnamed protein product [Acanthoscelides obtectus]CAK1636401.1 hypothetical protein AOBTE_LOCUS9834 [Acanthoscelides obtectus]
MLLERYILNKVIFLALFSDLSLKNNHKLNLLLY